MDLNDERKIAIDKAMKAFINGDYEPLKQLCDDLYYGLVKSEFTDGVVEERYHMEISEKKQKIKKLKEMKKAAANSKSPSLNDREYDPFSKPDEVAEIEGLMEETKLVDDNTEFLDDKARMNAMCMTGVFQIMFDNGLLKKRYKGKRMTKTLALKELNDTYKSNIGDNFFRDDPAFIKAAYERMPGLKDLVEKLKKHKT